jgi:opacity protein-like surface antigen
LAVAACALVAVTVVPAAAQSTSVGANLTFLREEGDDTGAGVAIDVAKGLTPSIAVAGEFGYNSFDGYSITSYLGGLRFTPAIEAPVQPFVQALFGLEHCCDQNAFAFQLGGGVEIPVSESLKVRGQYDYRHTRYDGEGFNGHRFGVGVVLPLGN